METKSAAVACNCSLGGYKVNTCLDRAIQRHTLLWQKLKAAKPASLFLVLQTINWAFPLVLEKELNEPWKGGV